MLEQMPRWSSYWAAISHCPVIHDTTVLLPTPVCHGFSISEAGGISGGTRPCIPSLWWSAPSEDGCPSYTGRILVVYWKVETVRSRRRSLVFEATTPAYAGGDFCNPGLSLRACPCEGREMADEKGKIESGVGSGRWNFLVPPPVVRTPIFWQHSDISDMWMARPRPSMRIGKLRSHLCCRRQNGTIYVVLPGQ